MTHKDIYTKFMIEYDKANVTSSYPSLTEYEAATLLDRAYLALIGQKFTGNNPRRVPFEYDEKAIADLAPLVKHADPQLFQGTDTPATNIVKYYLPDDLMYYVSSSLNQHVNGTPMDGQTTRLVPTKLVTHQMAEKFFNVEEINAIFDDYVGGNSDNWRKVWTIYTFLVWYEEYFVKR